jgi:hypothetical protein
LHLCFQYQQISALFEILYRTKNKTLKEVLIKSINSNLNETLQNTLKDIEYFQVYFQNNQSSNEVLINSPKVQFEDYIGEFYYKNKNSTINYDDKKEILNLMFVSLIMEIMKYSLNDQYYNKYLTNNLNNYNQTILYIIKKINNNDDQNSIFKEYLKFLESINTVKEILIPKKFLENNISYFRKKMEIFFHNKDQRQLNNKRNTYDLSNNSLSNLYGMYDPYFNSFNIEMQLIDIYRLTNNILNIMYKNFEFITTFKNHLEKFKRFSDIQNNHSSYIDDLIKSMINFSLCQLFVNYSTDSLINDFNTTNEEMIKGIIEEIKQNHMFLYEKFNGIYILFKSLKDEKKKLEDILLLSSNKIEEKQEENQAKPKKPYDLFYIENKKFHPLATKVNFNFLKRCIEEKIQNKEIEEKTNFLNNKTKRKGK